MLDNWWGLAFPEPCVRTCRVRVGLDGAVLCDAFHYDAWFGLREFKIELLHACPSLTCRFDIVRGVEKWRSYTHRYAETFLHGLPGEDIQIVLLPGLKGDPVVTDGALNTPLSGLLREMRSAIAANRDYLLLESGDAFEVPWYGEFLRIDSCAVCGVMGTDCNYYVFPEGLLSRCGFCCSRSWVERRVARQDRYLGFCRQRSDAELPGVEKEQRPMK